MEPSLPAQAALVAVTAAVVGFFLWQASRRLQRGWTALALLAGWMAVSAAAAAAGLLERVAPALPVLLLTAIVGTAVLAFSGPGRRLAERMSWAAVIGFQAFRIPVELILHRVYVEGVAPVQMTFEGRNFDILTGLTAVPLAFWAWRGRVPRGVVIGWNLMGLGLLLNILTVAVLSLPTPLRTFHNEPANTLPLGFPFVWLATVLVPAAWFGHLLVLVKPKDPTPHPGGRR